MNKLKQAEESVKRNIENILFNDIMKKSNIMLSQDKLSGTALGLFLKVPLDIVIQGVPELIDNVKKGETNKTAIFRKHFQGYVKYDKNEKKKSVYFIFNYIENDEKALMKLEKDIIKISKGLFFTFVYMHELQHIIRKHTSESVIRMMEIIFDKYANADMKKNAAANPQIRSDLINIAEDYAINYALIQLFEITIYSGLINNDIKATALFDQYYYDERMNEQDILKHLLEENVDTCTSSYIMPGSSDEDDSSIEVSVTTIFNEDGDEIYKSTNVVNNGTMTDEEKEQADSSSEMLSQNLQNYIKDKTRGTASADLIEEIFESVKANVDWFKKLKNTLRSVVYHKTHDYNKTWSSLNTTYRRIFKSPKKIFFDNKLRIIISIDQSGSMSTKSLSKILYVFEKEKKKIDTLTIIIHDTEVVHTFDLELNNKVNDSLFKEALATRYKSGGTSHDCVFKWIEENKNVDNDKLIYLSFSDNYSDIEESYPKYSVIQKITKFWINVDGADLVGIPGYQFKL